MSGLGAYYKAKSLGMSDGLATSAMLQSQLQGQRAREQEAKTQRLLEDINQFEADVVAQNPPQANKPKMYSSLEKHLGLKGLFGKDSPDQQHKETDLKFCEDARLAIKNGYEVFYTAYY